ncbi:MAG: hypothetical protein RJA70_3692 [Pseudomonadota bacterium]
MVLTAQNQFAGGWERSAGASALAPGALLVTGAVALVWDRVLAALASAQARVRAPALAAICVASLALGYGLTHGRHFEVWWRRVGFMGLLAALALGASWWLGPRLVTLSRALIAALSAGVLLLSEAANQWVLVRLYPAFHWALCALTIGCAVLLVRSLCRDRAPLALFWRRALPGAAGFVVLASALLLPTSAERLSRFDNFRWILLERAPILGRTVEALAWIAPPPPIEDPEATEAVTSGADVVLLGGRDVLLITIDALRADHLGSYGYGRQTTPHLDALAAEGVRFEHAYTATPHTSYAITSLMTGKYIRPLLLQGLGQDSDTWASIARAYGYRTAAFYPPAVFFIDPETFAPFADNHLGFEYQKKEFLEGEPRVQQLSQYLDAQQREQRLFTWVHLFGPHEPYVKDARFDYGDRDLDRYDSEVSAADHTVGRLVDEFRKRRPGALVIVTSDHGEEFGEHGGRYHGSSVYEEQVRVPLLIAAAGAIAPGVHRAPVQTIDLLPTVLRALEIPQRPRIRGRDLGPILAGYANPQGTDEAQRGFAFSETEEQALLAEGALRLVCARRVGACRLFNLLEDPAQTVDVAAERPEDFARLKQRLRSHNASHGRFEQGGASEARGAWPAPILRGIAGDGDAAIELAGLLDDAEVRVRRKSAELLYELTHLETTAALQLSLEREEDETVRRFSALALTRLGQGAALTLELLSDPEVAWRRRAALVLAETGDRRGHLELVGWWQQRASSLDHQTSRQVLAALAKSRSKEAVWPLIQSLDDVRLRPEIASALAAIGDESARGPLAAALATERYHLARTALAEALLQLGAGTELVGPLRRWLGVPDPMERGVKIATQAALLEHVGGPTPRELARARENAQFGELLRVVVPTGGNGRGLRLIVRASNPTDQARWVRVGNPTGVFSFNTEGKSVRSRKVPEIHPSRHVTLRFPAGDPGSEQAVLLPAELGLGPGRASYLVVLAEAGIQFESLVVVPLQDEPSGVPVPDSKATEAAIVPGTQVPKQ